MEGRVIPAFFIMMSIFTDGAFSRKYEVAGIGVFIQFGEKTKFISKEIPCDTNNIAELKAIEAALDSIIDKSISITLYSDSAYAIGVLTRGWSPQKNIELIKTIKIKLKRFTNLKFEHVKGHDGNPGNEISDALASAPVLKAKGKPAKTTIDRVEKILKSMR